MTKDRGITITIGYGTASTMCDADAPIVIYAPDYLGNPLDNREIVAAIYRIVGPCWGSFYDWQGTGTK